MGELQAAATQAAARYAVLETSLQHKK